MNHPKTEPADTPKNALLIGFRATPQCRSQALLKTLYEQAGEPDNFRDGVTKTEEPKLIDEMREQAE
jgi:hypothetical protein